MQIWLWNIYDHVDISERCHSTESWGLRTHTVCKYVGVKTQRLKSQGGAFRTDETLAEYQKKKKTRPSIITDMEINKLVFQVYEAPNSEKSKTRFFNTSWLKLHLFCNSTTSSCKATLCYASMALYMLCLLTRVFCSPTFFLKNSYSCLKTLFKHHSSCANLLTFPGRLILSCMLLLYLNFACIAVFSPREWEIWDKKTCMLRAQYLESSWRLVNVFELN